MIRILSDSAADAVISRKAAQVGEVEETVRGIIDDVRENGDDALLRYARTLDGFDRKSFVVPPAELLAARESLNPALREALTRAADNIRAVARWQLPQSWIQELSPGCQVGQIVRAIERMCAYVPSGRHPLLSTLLMTVIPAQVAGVPFIAVTSPRPPSELLATAALLDQEKVYLLGGAHAIAAFAFGTETVPRVDRIVGPGNAYVSAAKKFLAGEVAIDFVAGPTEILIIARDGNPAWIAADMLAQAEHDTCSAALFLTTSSGLADSVAREIDSQLSSLPTSKTARQAIERNSAIVVVDSIDRAMELANRYAPEHISLDRADLVDKVRNAGSIFVGPYSPEAAGDYASGPNHVLPTSGAARVRGGLSAADFVKVISVQELSAEALNALSPVITELARVEGLEAHARSVEMRFR
jgi:histidinol dehydrogenase